MIRLAVIGTNWITQKFVEAAHDSGKMRLTAVYSRTLAQAESFAQAHQVDLLFDSIDEFAASTAFDVVYIASPNALHAQQAILMMQHKKHVICEKPLASNLAEVEAMVACAKQHDVVLIEAFKTAYLPNFNQIKQLLPQLGKLRKAFFSYCQYSSRYQRYLDGDNPNTFNPQMSNGSIMDIGYYCLASMVALWGEPKNVLASATLLASGVDAHGSVIANYGEFDVVISHSKVSDSHVDSEIQGENGTLLISKLSNCLALTLIGREGGRQEVTLAQYENTMRYEVEALVDLIERHQIDHVGLTASLITAKLLTEIRRQTGVVFPADKRR